MNRVERLLHRSETKRCHYCAANLVSLSEYRSRTVPTFGDLRRRFRIATLDHRTPKKRHGVSSLDNIVLCCLDCNQAKGAMTEEEFLNGQ